MLKGAGDILAGKKIVERRMEMITNNIANATTPGYRSSKPLSKIEKVEDMASMKDQTQGNYTSSLDTFIDFTHGAMTESGGKLDVAIEGDGFFVVKTPEGDRYTRNGQFALNKAKKLVTKSGDPVMGQGGEITLNGKDIMIESDGSIFVDKTLVTKLKVIDFKDKKDLRNFGRSMFINTNSSNSESAPEKFAVKQGSFEASNVNVMTEMIDMMSTVRAYESYSKVDGLFSDMMGKLINIGR